MLAITLITVGLFAIAVMAYNLDRLEQENKVLKRQLETIS